MFKPIKDFITFIQSNASTNGSEDELNEESNTMDNIESDERNDSTQEKLINRENGTKMNVEATKSCVLTTNDVLIESDVDEDDIELQIKSSIMLKNPLKSSTPSPTPTTTSSVSSVTSSPCTSMTFATVCSKSYSADHNQNLQQKSIHFSPEDDDELADFKHAPLISTSYEDFQSLPSESEETHVNSADEIRTEEEDTFDETYSDESVKREIYVVIENDLNSSIASSSAEDPLAIDISTLPTSCEELANPLDNATSEGNDVSSMSGINWLESQDKSATINSTAKISCIEIERISNTVAVQAPQHSSGNQANISESNNTSRNEEPNEEMERCDNSDSGLGTETSSLLLQTTLNNSIAESSNYQENNQLESTNMIDGGLTMVTASSPSVRPQDAPSSSLGSLRSNLKRRYCNEADVDTNSLSETCNTKDQDIYTSKKPKRCINFDTVQVYYFPRQQGFGCVPSAGGCTLGMGTKHIDYKRLTLAEHAAELRRAHRLQLQEVNPRGSSSEETDESEEDYLSDGSGSDLDADSNGFLQPVPPKQRRAILKAAGIRKIDTTEKVECRNIRNSREVCGCTCRDFCDPETCSCSRSGIKCQVDRAMFPCGCSRDACGNTTGRVEFNPARVRTHFIHTIMRLDMENRQQQQPLTLNGPRSSCGYDTSTPPSSSVQSHTMTDGNSISNHNGYYNMQTQSNYSSGYASPAYLNEHNANYYQQQPVTYENTTDGTTNTETPYHSLDSVDGGVFANNTTNTVSSYSDIIPNYCPNNSTDTIQFTTTEFHPSLTYTPTYLSYQNNQNHDNNSSYLISEHNCRNNDNNNIINGDESSFNSCSVPSRQPYSTPTTINTTNDSNFISLSTPINSSTRLSQINDLLQHNRNTTATLVAVSHHNGNLHPNTANSCANNNSNLNSSIETPTVNHNNKGSLSIGSNLARVPLTTVSDNPKQPSSENKPPDIAIITTPSIEYDSRVAIADCTT